MRASDNSLDYTYNSQKQIYVKKIRGKKNGKNPRLSSRSDLLKQSGKQTSEQT